ncbi:MAG: DUF359 domain-containing protein [Candidatus Caldarchaeales archaeon]
MKILVWPPRRRIVFSEEMKEKVREPLGELITGRDPDEVTIRLGELVKEHNPPIVIAVGDYVTSKLHQHKVRVDISVIDGKIERMRRTVEIDDFKNVFEAVNEPGTISPISAERLHYLIHSTEDRPSLLKIDGEEDLLGVAAILSSPEGGVVIYGQPGRGAVFVKVDNEVKKKVLETIIEGVSE